MKQKTSWIALTGLTALAFAYYSFYFFNGPPSLQAIVVDAATNEYRFVVNDLPDLDGPDADTLILLSHGDGSYFMGGPVQFAAHRHRYAYRSAAYPAFAEIVALYDDKKKPPGRTALIDIQTTGTGGLTATPPTTLGANKVQLRRSTNPVPQDSVTYIVTYEHPGGACTAPVSGTVQFTYNTLVFDAGSAQLDRYWQETPQTDGSAANALTKHLTFSGLQPNEQRSLFIRLKTRTEIDTGTTLQPPTSVQLQFNTNGAPACPPRTYADTIKGEIVAAGHDPNFKTAIGTDMCSMDSITWRIDFQNEGNAPVSKVVVADWIDTLVEFNSVRVVYSRLPVVDTIRLYDTREIRCAMPNVNLRGLKERSVAESDTRGYLILRGARRKVVPCNAVVNSARIFFDWNPPVTTATALVPFPCTDTCTACLTVADTIIGPVSIAAGDSLLRKTDLRPATYALLTANPSDWVYKWYPTLGLSNHAALFPMLSGPVRREYTLVASNQSLCQRAVVRVRLRPAQELQLSVGQVATSGCPNHPVWAINCNAGGPSSTNLQWHDGTTDQHTWSDSGLAGGQQVYVAVWDTVTGDFVEQWVNLPGNCPGKHWWQELSLPVQLALAAAALLVFFFLLRRFRQK